MAQIRFLKRQGVPIAGIGVQGHLHTDTFDRQELRRALDSLALFNLPIRITEFNIPGQRSKYLSDRSLVMTPEEEMVKAREMVDYYKICFAHPAVEGILMWGFWEGANWIPASSLYKRDWSPTLAADAYQKLIYNEWWTTSKGKTGRDGKLSIPAFYGKYKVTVNGVSREVDLSKKTGKVVVEF
jgi:GH35 family endo-1,4-beta-xylanase